MAFVPTKIPYTQTGFYSKIVIDYLNNEANLHSFFLHPANKAGLEQAIVSRQHFNTNRKELGKALEHQYTGISTNDAVYTNMNLLQKETTFTITTAHQPNIFTGPLYFLYKILHAVKLAAYSKQQFPQYDFVPVFYMGSEDADLDELGHVYINGRKKIWNTAQTGAVGRMKVDKELLKLIEEIANEVGVQPEGQAIIALLKKNYAEGETIQQATFKLVNELFGKYGVLVVIPDNAALKKLAHPVFMEELLHGPSSKITTTTGERLRASGYTAQAHSREINFFYLIDDKRERIEKDAHLWRVVNTEIVFTEIQLLEELSSHPERFSPNVILRGIFQEIILPNIAFIGGGGELAYWLQLKDLFAHYKVPYPVLVLRNSYLIVDERSVQLKNKLGFSYADFFQPVQQLQSQWVQKHSNKNLSVDEALENVNTLYNALGQQAAAIDGTLIKHVEALKVQAATRIEVLGKKMLRAEKRTHQASMHQIEKLKQQLFPGEQLQERVENFITYYAKYGAAFIDELYTNALALEQEFVVLEEK